jgi:hypothetical protein
LRMELESSTVNLTADTKSSTASISWQSTWLLIRNVTPGWWFLYQFNLESTGNGNF